MLWARAGHGLPPPLPFGKSWTRPVLVIMFRLNLYLRAHLSRLVSVCISTVLTTKQLNCMLQ